MASSFDIQQGPMELWREGQHIIDYPQVGDIRELDGRLFVAFHIAFNEQGQRAIFWQELSPPRPQVGWRDLFSAVAERLSR